MDEPRELKRFPRGEGCSECRAKRWYLENGFRYCQNGHRVQAWVEYDAADEDGQWLGQVTKRKRVEEHDKDDPLAKKRLPGTLGQTLFFECLQIILRKQVAWLIREKDHPPQLEAVVKDLWDLRIRGFATVGGGIKEDALFHSSQDDLSHAEDVDGSEWASTEESWDPSHGGTPPIPRVSDTLLLCYFGCVFLRFPTSLGDIMDWANRGELPYRTAYHELPDVVHHRLPVALLRSLSNLENTGILPHKLHLGALQLAAAYQHNYALKLPALNLTPITIRYAQRLALPVEVVPLTRTILEEGEYSLSFPSRKTRYRMLDIPEICTIAALVVVVKHFISFDEGQAKVPNICLPRMDWKMWNRAMRPVISGLQPPPEMGTFQHMDGEDIANADDATLDAILSSLFKSGRQSEAQSVEDKISAFFPVRSSPKGLPTSTRPLPGVSQKLPHQEVLQGLQAVQETGVNFPRDRINEKNKGAGEHPVRLYPAWRSTEDLPEIAKPFYQLAGIYAGLPLKIMVRAADMLETSFAALQAKTT